MAEFRAYPTCKYHYTGKTTVVQNPEEAAALGGGWASSPTAFAPYRGPRRREPHHNSIKWVDQWLDQDLSDTLRNKIKARLLQAHASFWKSPDDPNADTRAMILAFDGVASALFEAGLLSRQRLQKDIPALVWDSAIAGGWWRFASESRQEIFQEKLGHYWLWRDDSQNWNMLFAAEIAEWEAKRLEGAMGVPVPDKNAPMATKSPERQPLKSDKTRRLSSTITSEVAARRLGEFLETHHIGLTEFATRVGTTDRTLRSFREKGSVRRAIFDAIAREMGTSRESLLEPEPAP